MAEDTIYFNATTVSPGTTTTLQPFPQAASNERRNCPIVDKASDWSLAIARAEIGACRTVPDFMPALTPNQPVVGLTPYAVTLGLNAYKGQANPAYLPIQLAVTYTLDFQTFDNTGNLKTPWSPLTVTFTPDGGTVNFLAALNAALAGSTDTIVQTLSATLNAQKQLFFVSSMGTFSGAYQFTVNLFGIVPTGGTPPLPPAEQAFGFANLPPSTAPLSFLVSCDPSGTLTLPNAAFYQLPTLVTTQTASHSMVWRSQMGLVMPPPDTKGRFFLDGQALWTFGLQWFVGLFNETMLAAYTQLVSQCAAVGCFAAFQCPYLVYANNTFTLYADSAVVPSRAFPTGSQLNAGPSGMNFALTISFSQMLQDLLVLPVAWAPDRSSATLAFQTAVVGDTGFTALTCDACPTSNAWTPVGSYVFTSSQLPTRNEVTGPPVDVSSNITLTETSSATMLSDIIPIQGTGDTSSSAAVLYEPFQWRWIKLTSSGPISTVDLQFAWRNARTGTITPIQANPGMFTSLKACLARIRGG